MTTLAATDCPTRPRLQLVHSGDAATDTTTPARPHEQRLQAFLPRSVYVVDFELVLDVDGPVFELCPTETQNGPSLAIYTARHFLPEGVDPQDAESIAVVDLVAALDSDVTLEIDANTLLSDSVRVDDLRHYEQRRSGT